MIPISIRTLKFNVRRWLDTEKAAGHIHSAAPAPAANLKVSYRHTAVAQRRLFRSGGSISSPPSKSKSQCGCYVTVNGGIPYCPGLVYSDKAHAAKKALVDVLRKWGSDNGVQWITIVATIEKTATNTDILVP
jgi:hypothetical protein